MWFEIGCLLAWVTSRSVHRISYLIGLVVDSLVRSMTISKSEEKNQKCLQRTSPRLIRIYFWLSYHGSGANWDFNSEKPSYARSACSNDESNAHNFIKHYITSKSFHEYEYSESQLSLPEY